MKRIGFIGLGNMGIHMAANLVKAGYEVEGFDLSNSTLQAAAAKGINIAASAIELAKNCDVVFTMLPAGPHVVSVWENVVPALKAGAIIVDSSTIDIQSSQRGHGLAKQYGRESLDAPVSGGVIGAQQGTLTFMVGGEAATLDIVKPILESMGKRIVHCGKESAGQAAKICNQMIAGISMVAVCEAFVLAEKLGLDHQAFFDVASNSSGQCWSLVVNCPVPGPVQKSPANFSFRPGFAADLMLKDLRLGQLASSTTGAATPMGGLAAQLYTLLSGSGRGGEDFSSMINLIRGQSAAAR